MMGSPRMGPVGLRLDDSITDQKVTPGTVRRILPYAARYRRQLAVLMLVTILDSVITAASPLILKMVIDDGILPRRLSVVVWLSSAIAALAVADALAIYVQTRLSGRIGEGLIYDLRTKVFRHVQRQPLAFFTRTQTGSLVSRLNTDVVGAQQAVTTLLAQTTSTVLTVILVLASMFYLSWQIALVSLVMIPLFLVPAKLIGRRLQRLTRQMMQLDAEMSSLMSERFNVSGAMLSKLYGRPEDEAQAFAKPAGRVRAIGVISVVYARTFGIIAALLTALTTALVYGLGGSLVIGGAFKVGTLVAMVTLLLRLYGPVNQLSGVQINVMTALISFDRVFEVLDLQPLITDRPGARHLPEAAYENGIAPSVEFDRVSFRYPSAAQVSLASLEAAPRPAKEHTDDDQVLHELSFRAPAGRLTALVGLSGAGKTTVAHLVSRLYDATSGSVRIGGHDIRDLTLQSVRGAVGVVSQDAHMFHDTIRANVAYARSDATDHDLVEACRAARIWDTISALPDGLDTVVGERGHRLSGGERQRVALARLLLKSPPVVVLDEATAHLDSESEAAIQRALRTALSGRTSLVIAHRLSTVIEADQILVMEAGRVRECGTHDELLAEDGLYAKLYRTQFAGQNGAADRPAHPARPAPGTS
ncbi:ABC transporter ATP-binding protein [Streptomyces coacervatus]|nr:ABC transporter ATP-binding protein [Streptomyces coacervatus]MDF2265043.1 ABC transporter ATP-binding protein [Streptomyces coacervatus]